MTEPPHSGHLDLDTLADLEEGLVAPAEQPAMQAHLDDCGQCRESLTRLRTTRALVSTLPAVPMPPDVAARLDAAIEAAGEPASNTVVPLARRRRWRRAPTLAGAAAAAAIVLLVAAIITGRATHDSSSPAGGGTAALGRSPASTAPLKEWQTGNDYTATTIATLVPRLVTGTPPPTTTSSGTTSAGGTSSGGGTAAGGTSSGGAASGGVAGSPAAPPTAAPSPAQDKAAAGQLDYSTLAASSADVLQCARILNGGPPVTPVAVDFARFAGKPAVVFVLPTVGHPETLDVWVVRTVCSASSFDLYFRRIPRPSG